MKTKTKMAMKARSLLLSILIVFLSQQTLAGNINLSDYVSSLFSSKPDQIAESLEFFDVIKDDDSTDVVIACDGNMHNCVGYKMSNNDDIQSCAVAIDSSPNRALKYTAAARSGYRLVADNYIFGSCRTMLENVDRFAIEMISSSNQKSNLAFVDKRQWLNELKKSLNVPHRRTLVFYKGIISLKVNSSQSSEFGL